MIQEPHFLVDEYLLQEIDELKDVAKALEKKHSPENDRSLFLWNFTNALFHAYLTKKQTHNQTQEEEKNILKKELEKKKKELLTKLEGLKHAENPLGKKLVFSKVTKNPLVSSSIKEDTYTVTEPPLTQEEQKTLSLLQEQIKPQQLLNTEETKKAVFQELQKHNLPPSEEAFDRLRYYLVRDLTKLGKISPLLEDPKIEEVVCTSAGEKLTVKYDGKELFTNITFGSDEDLNMFITHLSTLTKGTVSPEHPFLNATFDGFEIQASLGAEHVSGRFVIVRK